MKTSLLTTKPSMTELKRIGEEAQTLGHQFSIIDISEFTYQIKDNQLVFPPITNLKTDIAIFRAIFHNIKSMVPLANHLRNNGARIFDNNLLKHSYSIHKVTDLIKFTNANLPQPYTLFAPNIDDYQNYADNLPYPVILKLTRTGKGAGVYKADTKPEFIELIARQHRNGQSEKPFILQQYISYVHDLRILIIGNDIFAMKRIPKDGEFRANFSIGGSVEPFKASPETLDLAKRALHAADLTVGGVDILIDKDGNHFVLEVNHTPGMVGMEQATGQNITSIYLNHVLRQAS